MVLFRLSLRHNDSYAFRDHPNLTDHQGIHQKLVPEMSGQNLSGTRRCQACSELLAKWDEPLTQLVVKKRKYNISVTYDGMMVVSAQFVAICESNNLSGLIFRQLPNDSAFPAIYASRFVDFDAEHRKTRFIRPCQDHLVRDHVNTSTAMSVHCFSWAS